MEKNELFLWSVGLLSAIIGGGLFWRGQTNMAIPMTFGIGIIFTMVFLAITTKE